MKCKQLGLRVLSTAAIMSIVSSIAMPAFADIYYIGNGSIDIKTKTSEDGTQYVEVTQRNADGSQTTYTDTSDEIVIKDGTSENNTTLKEANRAEGKQATVAVPDADKTSTTSIGESSAITQETAEEEAPVVTEEKEQPEETAQETPEEPEQEEETPAEDGVEEESKEEPETQEQPEEEAQEEKPVETEEKADEPEEAAEEEQQEETETPAAEPTGEQEAQEQPKAEEQTEQKQETQVAAMDAADAGTPVAQDGAPAPGSTDNPTNNVIRIINDWAEKVLNIRLSNVNIQTDYNNSTYADGTKDPMYSYRGTSALQANSTKKESKTKIELDGQNVLTSYSSGYWAALNKKGSGNLTITDETDDTGTEITAPKTDTSGSLKAQGTYYGGASIGGNREEATENITIEGYANVTANEENTDSTGIGGGGGADGKDITIQGNATVTANGGLSGAGIGGGSRGDTKGGSAENITIQGNANVTVTSKNGAGIGGGSSWSTSKPGGSAKNILIQGNATVKAENSGVYGSDGDGAAIGAGGECKDGTTEASITIGGNAHVTASSLYGSAIGNGNESTTVTIQDNATIDSVSSNSGIAIGGAGGNSKASKVDVTIKDNATVKEAKQTNNNANYPAIGGSYANNVNVTIEGNAHLGEITGGIGAGFDVTNTTVNIKDNATIDKITTSSGCAIGGNGQTTVSIDGGADGKVQIGAVDGVHGAQGYSQVIKASTLNIGNNVLLKLKQNQYNGNYIVDATNTEALIGSSQKPEEGGLINTIGDKTEIWYTDSNNKLVRIVHGKDQCVWDEGTVTTAPTCHSTGVKTYHCIYEKNNGAAQTSCDREKTEEIPATAHNWVNDGEHHDANCVSDGYQDQKCSNDGCDATQRVWDHPEDTTHAGDSTKHDYEGQEWVIDKEATCTTEGQKHQVCKNAPNDESHYNVETIEKTAHTPADARKDVVEATEDKPGYTGDVVCKDCGTVIEKGTETPATGHNWVKGEHHDATCVKGGSDDYTCSGCGATKNEPDGTQPNPDAHDYSGQPWVKDTDATCTAGGKEHQECKNAPGNEAHYNYRDTEKDPDNHTDVKHDVGKKDPTCTEPGYTGDTVCDGCHETIEKGEVIPALGHEYEEKVTKEPTCTEDGEKTFTCKRNDDSYTEKIPATGHQHTEVIGAKDPTCTEPGYTGDTVCKDCGEIVKQGEEIPATGHQHTHIEGQKDATDTEPGYTGDTVCDDCGAVIGKGESIPAKGVPADENNESVSTPELWVVAPDTIRQTFTVRQNGTERIYTSPYNSGTLTGTMEILQYLQEQGVETIVFNTNQRTSRFAVADLLALVGEGDVFYLRHMDAAEPTLLVIANDHSDLLNG